MMQEVRTAHKRTLIGFDIKQTIPHEAMDREAPPRLELWLLESIR